MTDCDAFVSTASAHSFLQVNGSGTQRAFLTNATQHSADLSSVWTTQVDKVNGSAVVTGSVVNY